METLCNMGILFLLVLVADIIVYITTGGAMTVIGRIIFDTDKKWPEKNKDTHV